MKIKRLLMLIACLAITLTPLAVWATERSGG